VKKKNPTSEQAATAKSVKKLRKQTSSCGTKPGVGAPRQTKS